MSLAYSYSTVHHSKWSDRKIREKKYIEKSRLSGRNKNETKRNFVWVFCVGSLDSDIFQNPSLNIVIIIWLIFGLRFIHARTQTQSADKYKHTHTRTCICDHEVNQKGNFNRKRLRSYKMCCFFTIILFWYDFRLGDPFFTKKRRQKTRATKEKNRRLKRNPKKCTTTRQEKSALSKSMSIKCKEFQFHRAGLVDFFLPISLSASPFNS